MREARAKRVSMNFERNFSLLALSSLCACVAPAVDPGSESPVDMLGELDQDTFMAMHELSESPVLELRGRTESIDVPGHGEMTGYYSEPTGLEGPLPGVVMIHEWWGLNDHIRLSADRVAGLGYAVLAVDLYQGTVASTREQAMAAMQGVERERASATLRAARAWLENTSGEGEAPVASIGWCFGGGWSMQLALEDPELDGAIVYYGRTEVDPAQAAGIQARVLGVFGSRDRGIDSEYVEGLAATLSAAQVDHRFLIYDADHAFANPSSARYDHEHAGEAWEETQAFLAEVFAAGASD